jgi:hypothetical protein
VNTRNARITLPIRVEIGKSVLLLRAERRISGGGAAQAMGRDLTSIEFETLFVRRTLNEYGPTAWSPVAEATPE